jgi:hypothetical protein
MASMPTEQSKNTVKTPTFPRVEMKSDHDDILACCATLAGKTLEEVKEKAIEKCKIPPHGPYWFDEKAIARLFAAFGFVAQPYREISGPLADIPPDTALLLVDYNADTECGRHVIMQRVKGSANLRDASVYVIDVAHWIDRGQQVRADPKDLMPAYYIGIHDTRSVSGGKK